MYFCFIYSRFLARFKDKCRKIKDSDNYRPIALASVISKVESRKILLTRMSDLLITRPLLVTNLDSRASWVLTRVYYALKKIVENHRSLNGSMFMGLLDASKAFDRLKHSLLFQKLIDRKVPGYIIRIMILYWYASQTVKQCMHVGPEYCRMDFMLRTVYDKMAFCLLTYLMYILMT